MKKVALLVLALGGLAIAVPVAQTSPTSESGCTEQHVSGVACQGPDANAAANSCEIYTWVGDASCDLTVPDGVASAVSGTLVAYAENQETNWHAEFNLEVRDKSTQQLLYSNQDSLTVPIIEQPIVPTASLGFGNVFSEPGGNEVVCKVSGTHNIAGTAFSAIAATTGAISVFNNTLGCTVN